MPEYQLTNFIGKKVQIDRGGPESKGGIILSVGSDYLVLSTPEGNLYYYIEHIKSITLSNFDLSSPDQHDELIAEFAENNDTPNALKDVFASKKYRLIQINRGGPEKIKGLITEIYDDYMAIVAKEEVVLVIYSHIKNCSFPTAKNEEDNKDENKDQNKDQNKEQNNNSNGNARRQQQRRRSSRR